MIISHEHRYVFVEIPHTGSHSIAAELVDYHGGQRILRKHANLTQFMAQASAEERKYFVFGTVRNPLDTAVTDYSKLASNHNEQFTDPTRLISVGGHITRDHVEEFDFVNRAGHDFETFMQRYRNKIYHNWFLVGAWRYDYVLRFENLAADYETLIGKLGLTLVRGLPHVNRTKKKIAHFSELYSPALRPQVVRCYGPFMRHWGYAFPSEWGPVRIPWTNIAKFELVETLVNTAARIGKLDPDNPRVGKLKKLVERVL